jgi:hypothetical protein
MSALSPDPQHPDTWLIPAAFLDGRLIQAPLVIRGVHLAAQCAGAECLIHNPTHHHMRRWPLLWLDDQKVFARLCEHGYAHPDPDSWGHGEHPSGCDGCCQR